MKKYIIRFLFYTHSIRIKESKQNFRIVEIHNLRLEKIDYINLKVLFF